jgi:alkylated DNA repair dioxygenase AlkB
MERITLSDDSYILQGTLNEIPYDYEKLWNLHPLEKGKVMLYGKIMDTPRFMQSYGKPYTFSHVHHDAVDIPIELQPFIDWANEKFEYKYNTVFMNWYVDGSHYINAHSDNEKTHIKGSPIISISLGATRTFRIRDKFTKEKVKDIQVTDKSYIVMCGNMQKEFTHEIVKINGNKGKLIGSRINITIRAFV